MWNSHGTLGLGAAPCWLQGEVKPEIAIDWESSTASRVSARPVCYRRQNVRKRQCLSCVSQLLFNGKKNKQKNKAGDIICSYGFYAETGRISVCTCTPRQYGMQEKKKKKKDEEGEEEYSRQNYWIGPAASQTLKTTHTSYPGVCKYKSVCMSMCISVCGLALLQLSQVGVYVPKEILFCVAGLSVKPLTPPLSLGAVLHLSPPRCVSWMVLDYFQSWGLFLNSYNLLCFLHWVKSVLSESHSHSSFSDYLISCSSVLIATLKHQQSD